MLHVGYLAFLLGGIFCIGLVDYRYKLALFANRKRTLITIAIAEIWLLAWDVGGTRLHIFFPGGSKFVTGVLILPDIPIEELFFLLLLNYSALLLWRFGAKK